MRRLIRKVLFSKKKNYRKPMRYNFVTWNAHNKLQAKLDNLMRHLKLQSIGNSSLIGDSKDAKKFRDQFDY